MTRGVLFAASFLALVAPAAAAYSNEVAVRVAVKGEGPAVRVQVYASPWPGHECDSSLNTRILDGTMEVGSVREIVSRELCVCYRNTNGYFRKVGWENQRLICLPTHYPVEPSIRITIHARKPP
jgi:hypothetical protein